MFSSHQKEKAPITREALTRLVIFFLLFFSVTLDSIIDTNNLIECLIGIHHTFSSPSNLRQKEVP